MKKITLLSLHLGYGGVEKCIVSLANALVESYDVQIVSIYKIYDKPGFKIDKRVKVIYLLETDLALKVSDYKNMFFRFKWLRLIKTLFNDYIKKGHIISLIKDFYKGLKLMLHDRNKALIEFLKDDNSEIYISSRILFNNIISNHASKSSYKIAWEHNHHHGNVKYAKKVIDSVKKMDRLIVVSKDLQNFYNPKTKCKTVFIPNTIDNVPSIVSKLNNKKLVSIGRLSPEKGYLDLLKTFNLLIKYDNKYTLDIIGDGEDKEILEEYIKHNKLSKNVTLHGFQNKSYIDKILKNSSLYLMSSFTESFGIVLVEAMSYGIPCIAFNSAEGAREIIKDNKNGFLIDNRSKVVMAKKIHALMNDKDKLQKMGINAKKTSENYTIDKIIKSWIKVIEKK